jgi:CHAD domain-containing protein
MTTRTYARYRLADDESPSRVAGCLSAMGSVETGPAKAIESDYFDTFDWRLFGAGMSLCRQGPELLLHDHGRGEAVASIRGSLPSGFAFDFPPGRVRDLMADIIDVRRLLARVTLISKQTPMTLRDKEGKAVLRLALERVKARQPGKARAVPLGTRLTVAAVRGYDKVEAKARRRLDRKFSALSEAAPLYVEGLAAIGVTAGDYSSKLRLALEPEMPAGEAARHIHLTLLETMALNEKGSAGAIDPEYLHDFRVAVRRTRSALGQVDKGVLPDAVIEKAKMDFRWVGQQTNHMRDIDVYLLDYPKLRATLPAAYKQHLQPFHDYLADQSRTEIKKVAAMLRGKRYRRIRDEWRAYLTADSETAEHGKFAEQPVKRLADRRIWKVYRSVMKEGGAIDADSPAEALHELRITCKKLRYLLEFFQSLYPQKPLHALVKSLKMFQNVLGEFQDTEVQSQAILAFGREMVAAGVAPMETQMAMGMVADSILQRQAGARRDFDAHFEAFSRRAIRKSFAHLFKT